MRTLGVDPGRNQLGLAIVEDGVVWWSSLIQIDERDETRTPNPLAYCENIMIIIRDLYAKFQFDNISIERMFVKAGAKKDGRVDNIATAAYLGVCALQCYFTAWSVSGGDVKRVVVSPKSWKKTVLGNGNSTKDEVYEFVTNGGVESANTNAIPPKEPKNKTAKKAYQNICDAICIALHGEKYITGQ